MRVVSSVPRTRSQTYTTVHVKGEAVAKPLALEAPAEPKPAEPKPLKRKQTQTKQTPTKQQAKKQKKQDKQPQPRKSEAFTVEELKSRADFPLDAVRWWKRAFNDNTTRVERAKVSLSCPYRL